jgi:alpha-galactosidase
MKIVVVGAGSREFGRGLFADLSNATALHGRGLELVLVDLDEERLARMTTLARRMSEHASADYAISCTTDVRAALPGAGYVVVSIARDRYALWEQDYRVPAAFGFRQILGENGGPGALFHALRSIHMVVPLCRVIEELCPDALVLNYTNPEMRVLHAIGHLTSVRAAGLCHGVFSAAEWAAESLDMTAEDIRVTSAGMNHLFCLVSVIDRQTGQERLPELVVKARTDDGAPPLFRRFADVFGVVTYPSDDHCGEYTAWGTEYHDGRWFYGQELRGPGDPIPHAVKPLDRVVEAVIEGAPMAPELMLRTSDLAVPVIVDVELDRGSWREAVDVLNTEGYIDNLPRSGAVEVPAIFDAAGMHPVHVGPIPEPFAALIRTQLSIAELITEAYRTCSRKLALQALLLDPVVDGIARAERLLDTMLELQKDYLPPLE